MGEIGISVKLKKSTIKLLKEKGIFGETYDELILRLVRVDNIDKATKKASYEKKL